MPLLPRPLDTLNRELAPDSRVVFTEGLGRIGFRRHVELKRATGTAAVYRGAVLRFLEWVAKREGPAIGTLDKARLMALAEEYLAEADP